MADRHKSKPKAVRMPDGLLAWYEQRAEATKQSVNGAIVAALEEYRDRHGGSTTAAPAAEVVAPRKRKPAAKPPAGEPEPKTTPRKPVAEASKPRANGRASTESASDIAAFFTRRNRGT
jgi:hypothetical protein